MKTGPEEFLEFIRDFDSSRVMIRVNSITNIEEVGDGTTRIDGILVKCSYDKVIYRLKYELDTRNPVAKTD